MPSLEELVKNREKKKFTKKAFRPWDLTGKGVEKLKEERQNFVVEEAIADVIKENAIFNKDFANSIPIDNTLTSTVTNTPVEAINREEIQLSPALVDSGAVKPQSKKIDYNTESNLFKSENFCQTSQIKILNLYGLQKSIFFILLNKCMAKNSFSTSDFATNDLRMLTGASKESIKTSILRLINKRLVVRYEGKRAKGGYLNLGFEKEVLSVAVSVMRENELILKEPNDCLETVD